jgi:hypothetical protein
MRPRPGNNLRHRRRQLYFVVSRHGLRRAWVLPLREAFPLHMNDFDRRLEFELARLLDRVVRTPAPPRRGDPVNRPVVKLYSSPCSPATKTGLPEPPRVSGVALYS